jgi:hypothetical protein
MLNKDFNNGKKLHLHSALAVFTICMGFLFLIDAVPGVHYVVAGSLILFGFAWYFGSRAYSWWEHSHPH